MRTLEEALKAGKTLLKEKNIEEWDIDAWYLLSHCFHINRAQYILQSTQEITKEEYNSFMELIYKRGEHIPLQYITGEQEFMGLNFKVSDAVLIPRQDTEILVEAVLKVSEEKDVLDLCTGSGCIIISLSKLGNIRKGVGVDISKEALSVAKLNAKLLQAEVTLIESDVYSQIKDKYDIIVSNPPYIPTKDIEALMCEVKDHEPRLALDGSLDGLSFYRLIINGLKQHLNPGGYVFFEIGYNQGNMVKNLLEEVGIKEVVIMKDMAGLDRVVKGCYEKALEPFT